ncbi:MAG TPA: CPBP family intramembrane glutamic endopeptidase [Tepidisphaeraceae bacterium]|jgi:membrane protease YdiL (CAAX protease family)
MTTIATPIPLPTQPARPLGKGRAAAITVGTILLPLVAYLLFSTIYITAWYAATHHQGQPPARVIVHSMFIALPPGYLLTLLILWLTQRRFGTFAEIFNTHSRSPLIEIAVGIALGAAWIAFYGSGVVPFEDMFVLNKEKLLSMPASLSAGFGEELFFRGFLLFILTRARASNTTKIIVSAIAFGVAHMLWGPVAMFWTMVLGATLAGVTVWRRSVWAAIIAHTLLDLCIEPALFYNAMQHASQRH